jgi:hypothetical protein
MMEGLILRWLGKESPSSKRFCYTSKLTNPINEEEL